MTTHRWVPLALLMVSLCALSTQSSAQETSPREGVIRINVDLVQVDAIVTDSKGKPVTDLTADDFTIFDRGRRQKIALTDLDVTATEKANEQNGVYFKLPALPGGS